MYDTINFVRFLWFIHSLAGHNVDLDQGSRVFFNEKDKDLSLIWNAFFKKNYFNFYV